MSFTRSLFTILLVLASAMIFATYTPSDPIYFWMYWCTIWVFLAFGFLIDLMFCDQISFVFDPNPDVNDSNIILFVSQNNSFCYYFNFNLPCAELETQGRPSKLEILNLVNLFVNLSPSIRSHRSVAI
jgi:hypothetical protein